MNREQFLKDKIKQKGMTVKEFALSINMPYSTLLSMLNGSIGGSAVDKVIAICNGLGISIQDMEECCHNVSTLTTPNNFEIERIKKYHSLDESGKRMVDMVIDEQYKRCTGDKDAEFSGEVC